MYDDTCRFLAEHYSVDFANWLLGEAIPLTELKPSELSLEPIRADALILLESDEVVLHLEFQTQPKRDIPFRMLDYRVRVYRKHPGKEMRQVVLYLRSTSSELVHQTQFALENTQHTFEVLRVWEQPPQVFMQYPGLLPFAALSQTTDPETTLRQVAELVDQVRDPIEQANLTASSAILAGLRLENELIYRILRRDLMQESSVYQAIKAEGEATGEAKKQREIALNLLRDGVAADIVARGTGLSLEEVQQLQQQLNSEPHSS